MKVKTSYDVPKYLTKDKIYEVIQVLSPDNDLVVIIDDTDYDITIRVSKCAHLNMKPWTVVEE